uniref:Uncharacterized protein n=1 Tax=Salmo trutta TaxID=8032 RepID=A0A673Y2Z9_SALTR
MSGFFIPHQSRPRCCRMSGFFVPHQSRLRYWDLLPPMTHPGHATKPSSGPPCSSEPLPWLNMGSNSLMPFYTVVKPTCGYRFSREVDHKRRHIGIPASNPVMWRSC